MLRSRDICVGKCFVNSSRTTARSVLQATEHTITFMTYHLNTGTSCGLPNECTRAEFVHWAKYEIPPAALTRLKHQDIEA